jgi:enoyl-CoA hydratase/carnithine racemase
MMTSANQTESIEVSDDGHVRTLTFAREDKLNAFDNAMYERLAGLIDEAHEDDDVHVIVLAAKGRAFSAGQDLSEMGSLPTGDDVRSEDIPFELVFDSLERCHTPIFAAVEGFGLGFGLTVLLHTDQNFISEKARFRLPFLKLGVVPEAASSYLLPLRVGFSKAAEWIYEGRWIPATELAECGLVRELVEPGTALERAANEAAALAEKPPKATAATKRLLWRPFREEVRRARKAEGDAFRTRLGSPENLEALRKFQERS